MKTKVITPAQAVTICKQERLNILQLNHGPLLLKTGAKMYRHLIWHGSPKKQFVISGYAEDGTDLDAY